MSDDLKRYTMEEGRVYTDGENVFLPSVTTVLDRRPTPEGIKYWKKKYDGTGGNKHWRNILQYKSNRGTMIHYNLLQEFEEDDPFGTDEQNSTDELKLEGNWKRYQQDLTYAQDAWREIKQVHGIDAESVLDVECFVTNKAVGYAGQFDLLYVDDDSNIVLGDLKTGKGVYDKYKLQLTAYENALNLDVDRLEIIRIYPDGEEWEVSRSDEWDATRDELWETFCELRNGMEDVEEKMTKIAEEGIND